MPYRVEKTKHNRVAIACDNCRRRKTRCDAAAPCCGRCLEFGYECVYSPSERQSTSDNRFSIVQERLDGIDSVLKVLMSDMNELLKKNNAPSKSQHASNETTAPTNSITMLNSSEDVPLFNDRLAHLKQHTNGDQISTTVYVSSVFLSILGPKDIHSLSKKLNDPLLPQRLEIASHNAWRKTQGVYGQLMSPSTESLGFQPDMDLLEMGMKAYKYPSNAYIHPLLPPEDISLAKMTSLPVPLSNGVKAALIIVGSADMRLKSDYGAFSESFVESQERAAYYQAIRTLNLMRFSRPCFFSVRLAILLTLLVVVFSTIPTQFNLLDPILDMCRTIGLDRPEVNRMHPLKIAEWRERVWFLTSSMVYSQYIILSLKPLAPTVRADDFLRTTFGRPELELQGRIAQSAIKLHHIYNSVYEKLFLLMSRKCSAHELANDILNLGKEIDTWEEEYSRELQPASKAANFGNFIELFSLGNLRYKYLHIVLAVYSTPAFYPYFLPDPMPGSLEKVSKAARNLYTIALNSQNLKGECTYVNSTAVTAALCCLLYKQMYYPMHESNLSDLEMIKGTISQLDQNRWPCVKGENPQSEIWQVLLDIMDRHYQLHNVTAESKSTVDEQWQNGWDKLFPEDDINETDQCKIT